MARIFYVRMLSVIVVVRFCGNFDLFVLLLFQCSGVVCVRECMYECFSVTVCVFVYVQRRGRGVVGVGGRKGVKSNLLFLQCKE